MQAILIGAAVVWTLTAMIVVPLSVRTARRRLATELGRDPDCLPAAVGGTTWRKAVAHAFLYWEIVVVGCAACVGLCVMLWQYGGVAAIQPCPCLAAFGIGIAGGIPLVAEAEFKVEAWIKHARAEQ